MYKVCCNLQYAELQMCKNDTGKKLSQLSMKGCPTTNRSETTYKIILKRFNNNDGRDKSKLLFSYDG